MAGNLFHGDFFFKDKKTPPRWGFIEKLLSENTYLQISLSVLALPLTATWAK